MIDATNLRNLTRNNGVSVRYLHGPPDPAQGSTRQRPHDRELFFCRGGPTRKNPKNTTSDAPKPA
uniref:Uncharacterized protein n=1 Tax=Romanomermis culicivorax TaxID=13658 RepID=A0A915JEN9_ROMCU